MYGLKEIINMTFEENITIGEVLKSFFKSQGYEGENNLIFIYDKNNLDINNNKTL